MAAQARSCPRARPRHHLKNTTEKPQQSWSDLSSRAGIMRRFVEQELEGRQCVLLLCGVHDPGGLNVIGAMRKVGWSPDNLVINRFGLNADFINRSGFPWINNLGTSSGERLDDPRHPDHNKDYLQSYMRRFGVGKCEANALVVARNTGRDQCRRAILEHVPVGARSGYQDRPMIERTRLAAAIGQLLQERA